MKTHTWGPSPSHVFPPRERDISADRFSASSSGSRPRGRSRIAVVFELTRNPSVSRFQSPVIIAWEKKKRNLVRAQRVMREYIKREREREEKRKRVITKTTDSLCIELDAIEKKNASLWLLPLKLTRFSLSRLDVCVLARVFSPALSPRPLRLSPRSLG